MGRPFIPHADTTTTPTVRQNLDAAEAFLRGRRDRWALDATAHIRSARTILSQGTGSKWLVLLGDQLAIVPAAELRATPGIEVVYGRIVPDPDAVDAWGIGAR